MVAFSHRYSYVYTQSLTRYPPPPHAHYQQVVKMVSQVLLICWAVWPIRVALAQALPLRPSVRLRLSLESAKRKNPREATLSTDTVLIHMVSLQGVQWTALSSEFNRSVIKSVVVCRAVLQILLLTACTANSASTAQCSSFIAHCHCGQRELWMDKVGDYSSVCRVSFSWPG